MTNDKRSTYRKNLKMSGTLVSGDTELSFFTRNVSLSGFQAYSAEPVLESQSLQPNEKVYVRLPELSLEGEVAVSWTDIDANGIFNFGFKFIDIRGVAGNSYRYQDFGPEDNQP